MPSLLLGAVASAYTVTTVPIAFKTQLGTGAATASGTTVTITTTAAIAVDDLVVVRFATDNTATSLNTPTATCTDTGGNVYVPWAHLASAGGAASGVTGGLLASKATSAVSSGGTITLTLSEAVAHKAVMATSFTGTANQVRGPTASAGGTSGTAASSGASTSASSGDLVLGVVAAETRTTPTGDSDTSNGTWSTLVNVNSTTGGTDNTRVQVNGQYKIATGAGTQTYDNTLGASTDWVASTVVLQPSASAPTARSSVRFDNSADLYSSSAAASGVDATNFTMCCWMYRVTSSVTATVCGIQRASPDDWFLLQISNTNLPRVENDTAGAAISTSFIQLRNNGWQFMAANIGSPSGTARIYAAGAWDPTLQTASVTGSTGPNSAASIRIGGDTFGGQMFDGRIAGVKMWNATLSAAELELERWSYNPVRTSNLYAWYPLDGPSTSDASGNGHTLTAGGSLTSEAGPPYAS